MMYTSIYYDEPSTPPIMTLYHMVCLYGYVSLVAAAKYLPIKKEIISFIRSYQSDSGNFGVDLSLVGLFL